MLYLQDPSRNLIEALNGSPWAFPISVNYAGPWYKNLRFKAYDLVRNQIKRVRLQQEIINAKAYDRLLVNSLYSREKALQMYGVNAQVCYLGVDTDKFNSTKEAKKRYVITLGAMSPRKGIEIIIQALSKIEQNIRPSFIWISKNTTHQDYLARIQQMAKDNEVTFDCRINVPYLELIEIISKASLMVYTPRLEPFGLAVLEANACGTAVVGVAEAGVRETVQQGINGYLAMDSDPYSLAKLIAPFFRQSSFAYEMGGGARDYVTRNWSLLLAGDRLEQQLKDLISSKRVWA